MDRERDAGSEREPWHAVLSAVKRAARRLPKPKRRPKFPDWLVVALFLWAAWHDRCLSMARGAGTGGRPATRCWSAR